MTTTPFHAEVVLPLSQVADLTSLLYLNPELAAYSNVRTAETALSYFNSLSDLPNTMPALPPGFDGRVYIGAQPNVSRLNRAIRDSILAVEGGSLTEAALDRRGAFVGTLMCPATVRSAQDAGSDFPFSLTILADVHEGVLQQGDRLRLIQRGSGFIVDAAIAAISYGEKRITLERSTNPRYIAALADGAGAESRFEAFGIRVIDPMRQARVTYARALASSGTPPSGPDVVPAREFVYDTYQMLYPETRGFGFSDTYLDQRRKWERGESFRIRGAADLINSQDPQAAAPGGGTGGGSNVTAPAAIPATLQVLNALTVGPGNFSSFSPSNASVANNYVRITASSFAAGIAPSNNILATADYASLCANLVVGYSNASIRSPLIFQDSLRVRGDVPGTYFADISGTRASLGHDALVIEASSVVVRDDLRVGATIGVGTSNPDPATSGVRLAVAGDIFATGTVVTLSDSNAKGNIRTISGPLERVGMMTGCTFEMKEDTSRRHAGLIAQDVLRALPEAVYKAPGKRAAGETEDAAGGVLSVAYGNLAGLFVEALKELTTRLDAVERTLQLGSAQTPTPLP
jgi:hypothetical protein